MVSKTKCRRFRPRFGLKTLLGLMLVVSVVLASYRYLREQQRRQREFMTLAILVGAKFTVMSLSSDQEREITDPAQLRLLDRIVAVDLFGEGWYPFENDAPLRASNSDELAHESLMDLITLTSEGNFTWSIRLSLDAQDSIDRPPDLIGLKRLSLRRGRISNADLNVIGRLSQLEHLNLRGINLTDEGMGHLAKLSRLKHLLLGYTKISDAGLEHLRGLTRLETIDLTNTEVSDEGLHVLQDLTELRHVYLGDTHVTRLDFSRLPKLEYVDVIGAPIVSAKVAEGVQLEQGKKGLRRHSEKHAQGRGRLLTD